MEEEEEAFPSPSQKTHSSLFKDISNLKTPKPQNPNKNSHSFKTPKPNTPQFFTASKQLQTPSSYSFRPRRFSIAPSSSKSKTTRRLKAIELEQSLSSRKTQIQKEKSLKSLSKTFTIWLNFLFENPKACGCDGGAEEEVRNVGVNRKRDSLDEGGVCVNGPWRSVKRAREGELEKGVVLLSSSAFSGLKVSLREICSFDDLVLRLRGYLSAEGCKEVFLVMSKVTKNIDDGRLKMKAHCPIVTDVRLKEQAIRVLMCYNPIWLRIGLYIVFGGDSLLPNGDVNSDKEVGFLKMVVERQLFSHADLARAYAYNKAVEGLYRPGYFEALGNIILKRFLLLVLILDRAKSQSSLPIKYGIDGIDGGSPLLFGRQSNIKSTRQVIHDFLSSEVMHGEGDLLAHLVIVGYKASYQQCPVLDYDYKVKDLFDDLQNGVRLCRAIQLLKCDTSMLTKMVVPSDTHKKDLVNCSVALQYLKQAGVSLFDEDGATIVAEDVATGEKELILSLLWNIFVHLQLPLLVDKTLLFEEICKLNGADTDYMKIDSLNLLEMILQWIQAICQRYNIKIVNFASLMDGKAMWCLIDYYFRHELPCSSFCKAHVTGCEDPKFWSTDCSDAVHNFILSQKLMTVLGSFPEASAYNVCACNERTVVVLLVFLSSQLIGRKNVDHFNIHKLLGCSCPSPEVKRLSSHKCFLSSAAPLTPDGLDEYNSEDAARKFKVIRAWWRDMAKCHDNCETKQTRPVLCYSASKRDSETHRERAIKTIQSHFRRSIARRKFLEIKTATSFLQAVIQAWLTVKMAKAPNISKFIVLELSSEYQDHDTCGRHLRFMVQRHSFVLLRKSVLLIQRAARTWITRRRHSEPKSSLESLALSVQTAAMSRYHDMLDQLQESGLIHGEMVINNRITTIFTYVLAWTRWRNFIIRKCIAAIKIQSHWRAWLTRRNFLRQKKAVLVVQSAIRSFKCWTNLQQCRTETKSAIIIQSRFRGLLCRREANRRRGPIILIQSYWRGWLRRRGFLRQREAAISIQSGFRCLRCCWEFQSHRLAAIQIQQFARGQVARNRLLGASSYRSICSTDLISRGSLMSFELKVFVYYTKKLQRWWKRVLLRKLETRSAIIVQSHIRGWIAKQEACRERCRIVVIQSYWKGYLARKESREQLLDLRVRLQISSKNVDDGMRLINRLVSALSDLLNVRSVSSILHTCSTLDMATRHSQRCCETLVAAGAIDKLLKLIRSVSRSIPDQEVQKHALSTLRNLSRYPHLADVLIETKGSTETILREMLRNKEEGYFIASDLLKRLCSTKKGVQSVVDLPALLRRLHSLVDDLTRKVNVEKRKIRPHPAKEWNERRLREAAELLKRITNG
ncbi:hypothetical protein IFM89_005679 [Coptis chinensis]|uniref:Calponin-homology (CH) domain-containing protein n=1 Tax=Coptis chinensis TaxID=261450 RepID=A0A835GUW3_9MAGN|nr:hypothetical protein IFM89_005679 [Coptis chinensis]